MSCKRCAEAPELECLWSQPRLLPSGPRWSGLKDVAVWYVNAIAGRYIGGDSQLQFVTGFHCLLVKDSALLLPPANDLQQH